jgi:hypothetical protein
MKNPRVTMVSLWTWLVLVLKGKRRNLPFQNVSDNRTKIDLNLLVRSLNLYSPTTSVVFRNSILLFSRWRPTLSDQHHLTQLRSYV